MNENFSTRDSLLRELDDINGFVLESEVSVLSALMSSADKVMTIMEDFEGDFDDITAFVQEADDPNHPFQEDSTLKTILMFIPNLIMFIGKKIKQLFTGDTAQQTKASSGKLKGVADDTKNAIGEFMETGKIPDPLKIGGIVISGAALVIISRLFKDKIGAFVKKHITAARDAFKKIADIMQNKIKGIDPEAVWDLARLVDDAPEDVSKEIFSQYYFYCAGGGTWYSVLRPDGVKEFYSVGKTAFEAIKQSLSNIQPSNNNKEEAIDKVLKTAKAGIAKSLKTRPVTSMPAQYKGEDILSMLTYLCEADNNFWEGVANQVKDATAKLAPQNKVDDRISKLLKELGELTQTYTNIAVNLAIILKQFNAIYNEAASIAVEIENAAGKNAGESDTPAEGEGADAAEQNGESAEENGEQGKADEAEAGSEGQSEETTKTPISNDDAQKIAKALGKQSVEDFIKAYASGARLNKSGVRKAIEEAGVSIPEGKNRVAVDRAGGKLYFEYDVDDIEDDDDIVVDPVASSWYSK